MSGEVSFGSADIPIRALPTREEIALEVARTVRAAFEAADDDEERRNGVPEAPNSEVSLSELTELAFRERFGHPSTDEPEIRPGGRLPQFTGKMFAWAEAMQKAGIHGAFVEVRLNPGAFEKFAEAIGAQGFPLHTCFTINNVDFVRDVI